MKKCTQHSSKFCILCIALLAFLWIAGLIYGVCAFRVHPSVVSLMRLSNCSQVSIVGLVFILVLPLLISVSAVSHFGKIAIYVITPIRALVLGYTLSITVATFSQSAWLIVLFLLFSDVSSNLIYLWFVFRRAVGISRPNKDIAVATIFLFLIGITDHFIISPFWASLINRI